MTAGLHNGNLLPNALLCTERDLLPIDQSFVSPQQLKFVAGGVTALDSLYDLVPTALNQGRKYT